jgi:hypothetical protein
MMYTLNWTNLLIGFGALSVFIPSLIGLIRANKQAKLIFFGQDTSKKVIIANSLQFSGFAYLVFVSAIIIGLLLSSPGDKWNLLSLLSILIVFSPLILVIFLSSLWRFLIIGRFRGRFFSHLRKGKDK